MVKKSRHLTTITDLSDELKNLGAAASNATDEIESSLLELERLFAGFPWWFRYLYRVGVVWDNITATVKDFLRRLKNPMGF